MAFDEITATARLNLTDPAKIALLQPALDAAQAIAERYCDRWFDEADETEELIPVNLGALQVKRYPITSVASLTAAHSAVIGEKHINKPAGIIYLDSGVGSHQVNVEYKGGYAVLPPDLELALWLIFDAIWSQFNLPVTAGASAGGGAIKAIRSNGASIEYDTSGGSVSGLTSTNNFGLPVGAIGLLEPYRRRLC